MGDLNTEKMVIHKVAFTPYPPRPPIDDRYDKLVVNIVGLAPVAGPSATNLDTYRAMLDARLKQQRLTQEAYDHLINQMLEGQKKLLEAAAAEGADEKNAAAAKVAESVNNVNTFARNPQGILGMSCTSLHAMLRECFVERELFTRNRGWRDRFDLGLRVEPWFALFERNGEPLVEADALETRPCHVITRTGPQHSLKTREVINPPWGIQIVILKQRRSPIKHKDILDALGLLPTVGLGADRSQEYGSCDVGANGIAEESKHEGLPPEEQKKEDERRARLDAERKERDAKKRHAPKNRIGATDDDA